MKNCEIFLLVQQRFELVVDELNLKLQYEYNNKTKNEILHSIAIYVLFSTGENPNFERNSMDTNPFGSFMLTILSLHSWLFEVN
ncbi:hypothetical protein DERF_016671 [Dermatophagoides farinae]|uniref:Uncharacterized protein n=1 Tax=Dermatophagoides farinae TaxID=6954 RepID=A0A922L0K3_DERFA|nr:hypothetical protein DERF_016671 [Dermatophagoides farinae]